LIKTNDGLHLKKTEELLKVKHRYE